MYINMLKSKISYATVTNTKLYYVGSITIDQDILKEANILENEKVQVVNINNGERFETYVIAGEPGSGTIEINGPAARRCEVGDKVFILSYGLVEANKPIISPVLIDLNEEIPCVTMS